MSAKLENQSLRATEKYEVWKVESAGKSTSGFNSCQNYKKSTNIMLENWTCSEQFQKLHWNGYDLNQNQKFLFSLRIAKS